MNLLQKFSCKTCNLYPISLQTPKPHNLKFYTPPSYSSLSTTKIFNKNVSIVNSFIQSLTMELCIPEYTEYISNALRPIVPAMFLEWIWKTKTAFRAPKLSFSLNTVLASQGTSDTLKYLNLFKLITAYRLKYSPILLLLPRSKVAKHIFSLPSINANLRRASNLSF